MPSKLEESSGRLLAKGQEADELYKTLTDTAVTLDDATFAQKQAQFLALQEEMKGLHDDVIKWRKMDDAAKESRAWVAEATTPVHPSAHSNGRNGGGSSPNNPGGQIISLSFDDIDRLRNGSRRKSLGEALFSSPEMKDYAGERKRIELADYEFKTTLTEAGGFAPPNYRGPDVVPFALRRPVVADLIPQVTTNQGSAIVYMEETTNTNNAAPVAEGAVKPEDAFAYTQRTQTIEVIATTLPVSKQQLEDVPQIQGIINNSLTTHLMLTEETQLLTGTGTSPQLQGFLTKTGVQTQARGTDPSESAIFKAFTLIRYTGFSEPSGVVIHPTNWQTIRLHQDTAGRYVWGDPWVPGPDRIWGVPTVVTPAITLNTALAGDFATYSYIARRMGITVEMGYVNDNFTRNLKTILCEERLALIIRRPAAFSTITGLN
jgi:HK97 family phage major capsid protein